MKKSVSKPILYLVTYELVGVLLYIVTLLFDILEVINISNITSNCIIFSVSSVVCIVFYAYTYYFVCNATCIKECVIIGVIAILVLLLKLLFAFRYPGVHLSIAVTWSVATIALVVYSIIAYLRSIDSIEISKKKYTVIISELKTWINLTYVGSFFFGIVNIFFSDKFVIL